MILNYTHHFINSSYVLLYYNNLVLYFNFFIHIYNFKLRKSHQSWIYLHTNLLWLFDYYNKLNYTYGVVLKNNEGFKFYNYLVFFWLKITFRGKGFRVRKTLKSKKLTLSFGRSHWTKLWFSNQRIKLNKIRRQNYILYTFTTYDYVSLHNQLQIIKPINHYTKRGLRLKKQLIKKRFGKISQMISSLHF